MKKLNKKGFTLVELIVVIAIIGILAAVLVPSVTSYIGKANKSAAQQNASNKYQEIVLKYTDECQLDFNDYAKDKAFVFHTKGFYVVIEDGVVVATESTKDAAEGKATVGRTKTAIEDTNIPTMEKAADGTCTVTFADPAKKESLHNI